MDNTKNIDLNKDPNVIKKDRMRFTKNTVSSTLCYVAILFNALYFVFLYSINPSEQTGFGFFFTPTIGISVIINLLFMLFTFLSSEEVKNYSKKFSIVLIGIGIFQMVRIFGMPLQGLLEKLEDGTPVISPFSFAAFAAFLAASSICCIVAGVVGIIRTVTLENYKKETGLN